MTTKTETAVEETQAQQPEQAEGGLNINDLNTLRAIIDLASSRGAFKPTEMVSVGLAYNKLNDFLEEIAKQNAQADDQTQNQAEV